MNIINKVTLKILWKNKVRTLVTIIGIILSAAMITAVTTSISSLQNYLLRMIIEINGDWHGSAFSISSEKLDELKNNPETESMTTIQNIGYALLEDCINEDKPYLFIAGMDDAFAETMPVRLISGRLPSDTSEIILPKHLETNGGVIYSIGDVLKLDIGVRAADGFTLNQKNPLVGPENGKSEILTIKEQRVFTVVGFYERPNFEDYSSPGYTALTLDNGEKTYSYDVYLKIKNPKNIFTFMDENFREYEHMTNNDYLRICGVSDMDNYLTVFYSLAAILIGIIVFGSISLIYNAFSISVSERTKQFGLLSSIGATRKQMTKSVLYEAFTLSMIGIPLGILAGILGIGITFKFTEGLFKSFIGGGYNTVLHLSVTWQAIVIAALIGLITVLVSAYIPAKRAAKASAIDAIRMSKDVRIEVKKVKTSKLVYRLFGFEGMLARKNFKRNKRKYRATVISLFLSIVLFISASSFSTYLKESTGRVIEPPEYDILYSYTSDSNDNYTLDEVFNSLKNLRGVTESGYAIGKSSGYTEISVGNLSQDYIKYASRAYNDELKEGQYTSIIAVAFFIDDASFEKFLNDNSISADIHMDPADPLPVVYDYSQIFDYNEGRYYTINLLKKDLDRIDMRTFVQMENFFYAGETQEINGQTYFIYVDGEGNKKQFTAQEAVNDYIVEGGTLTDKKPFMIGSNQGMQITMIYPFSAIKKVLGEDFEISAVTIYFKTNDHKAVYDRMVKTLSGMGLNYSMLIDYAAMYESDRAIITVLDVFSYGFIVLISLIAAANVFNTISTNIGLRRREFAMLKSIGMTPKMFKRMMNFECLLYGIKGLLYGIPVSIGITYLIYRSISYGLETGFFIPWYSIVIAVGSVFLVVFATMLYSMDKIRKDNPIDALKAENL